MADQTVAATEQTGASPNHAVFAVMQTEIGAKQTVGVMEETGSVLK